MRKATAFKIISLIVSFWLLPMAATGCHAIDPSPIANLAPHYLLNGSKKGEEGDFEYYKIDGKEEYAIGLTENAKAKTSIGTLPTKYNGADVTAIWHNGFHNSKIRSITLGPKIKTIDFEAFLYCAIDSIIIPNSVEEIGDGAFYACPNLTSVYFGKTEGGADECACEVGEDTSTPLITKIPSFCFFKCNKMTTLKLPNSIVTIEPEAFNGCRKISTPIFLPKIQTIRSRAFQSCLSLSEVSIGTTMFNLTNQPSSCPGIEAHAFQYCDSNLKFVFYGSSSDITVWANNHKNWGWYTDGDPSVAGNKYPYTIGGSQNPAATLLWKTEPFAYNSDYCTITHFEGSFTDDNTFISIPDTIAGKKVAAIKKPVFDKDIKNKIKRLYLPKTLLNIENQMFGPDYKKLTVIADNTQCDTDLIAEANGTNFEEEGRIDLSGLTDLQFIGDLAFTNLGGGTLGNANSANVPDSIRDKIKSIHLPARLIAVGSSAFSSEYESGGQTKDIETRSGNRFRNVTDFQWDYIDPETSDKCSRLEAIGGDSFVKMGSPKGATNTNSTGLANYTHTAHKDTVLIFPRTFKHFGITDVDRDRYKSEDFQNTYKNYFEFIYGNSYVLRTYNRPAHTFAGCPLISKVYFKGGAEGETEDLVVPVQTFVLNESLQTIVFEERVNHEITFHTQWANYSQQSVGSSGGQDAGKVDFRGDPMLQTIVLPNKDTKIRVQKFAFFGNARAAMYFSGSVLDSNGNVKDDANIVGNTQSKIGNDEAHWPLQLKKGFTDVNVSTLKEWWRKIGDESFFNEGKTVGYHGYCFAPKATEEYKNDALNRFGIDQQIPLYDEIHYSEVVKDNAGNTLASVEVGANNKKELILDETSKCAFVCDNNSGNKNAIMTNCLFNLRNGSMETVTVPAQAIVSSGSNAGTYPVKKIGDSAFSACHCDGEDGTDLTTNKNLTNVNIPDSVEEIGDYAFMRAYGVKKVSATGKGDYVMPTSLKKIGKMAFAFSNLVECRKIPDKCVFYENTLSENIDSKNTRNIPSAFTNDLSLRLITFGSDNASSSTYYETTQYNIATSGDPVYRTCALYSKNTADGDGFKYFKNRLMLVLYRENSHKNKTSADYTYANSKYTFNGKYRNNAFLFGAFKMAYWIENLALGSAPGLKINDTYIGQPFFSSICNRNSSGTITDKPIYLNNAADRYDSPNTSHVCDLTSISGSVLDCPRYAFNGCEKLNSVELPVKSGGQIKDGLFANTGDGTSYTSTFYVKGATPQDNTVDLATSGYTTIGKEAFLNNDAITNFVAPANTNSGTTITIGASAFSGCDALNEIDFSKITAGTLVISASAFLDCKKLSKITWPGSSVTVKIEGDGAFKNCTALTSLVLPSKMSTKLGSNTFSGCTGLTSVSVDGTSTITSIGSGAFSGCTNLSSFDYDAFSNVTTIGSDAFRNDKALAGNVNFPAKWQVFGKDCFRNTGLESVTFLFSGSGLSIGGGAFAYNTSLTQVNFNKDCTFDNATYATHAGTDADRGIFQGCGDSLKKIFLPTSFNLNPNTDKYKMDNFVWGDEKVALCIYRKYGNDSLGENYRKTIGDTKANVCFMLSSDQENGYVATTIGELYDSSTNKLRTEQTHYWAELNGQVVLLGTTTGVSVDGENVTITFSSGYTLSSSSGYSVPSLLLIPPLCGLAFLGFSCPFLANKVS